MKLSELNLSPKCQPHAAAFVLAFGDDLFTSGRRTLEEQAHAMAVNVIAKPRWIEQTYRASPVRDLLQKWVDGCTRPLSLATVYGGLLSLLQTLTPEQLKTLTVHPTGDAFDVKPELNARGLLKRAWLRERAKACGGKFLEKEGGLDRWHFEV